jgi:hypothetical protein
MTVTISEEARAKLAADIKVLDERRAPFLKQMEPIRSALAEIDAEQAELEEAAGVEVVDTCECGRILVTGDLVHHCSDGPVLCESCSPTFNNIRRQYDDMKKRGTFADAFEDGESAADADEAVDSQIAAGNGDKKHVWVL